jgi:2,3-bisphosphoglycerate-dependent phosphoglycerate mutase
MAYLALVRHGQSEWNALGLWTGLTDISLNDIGREEARHSAEAIASIRFDVAYTSVLQRAQQTLDEIQEATGNTGIPIFRDAALNERDYGDLTGKNKWEVRDQYGEEQFLKWRRSWDYDVPGGESLKDVYARVVPYFEATILPRLRRGENVLVVAHGNSLRALVKHLESLSEDEVVSLEIGTAEVYLYEVDASGKIVSKEIRAANPNVV